MATGYDGYPTTKVYTDRSWTNAGTPTTRVTVPGTVKTVELPVLNGFASLGGGGGGGPTVKTWA